MFNDNVDLFRYKDDFEGYDKYDGSYTKFFEFLFSAETTQADIFIPIVGFIVYNLGANFKFYLAVLGLLYGYIYSRNIWYIIDRVKGNLITSTIIYILVFALIFPIWRGINGPRFSIGVHLFFFGVCKYIIDKKKYGLLIASLSIFSHFSCLFAVIILWIYVVAGNKVNIYFGLYAITLFFKEINVNSLIDLAESLPDVYSGRVNSYGNEEYAQEIAVAADAVNWYAKLYITLLRWTAAVIVILLYFKGKEYFKENITQRNLFAFTLLFLAFANIISVIPSGDRFLSFAFLFVFAIYAWFTNNNTQKNKLFLTFNKIATYSLLLFFIVEIRIGFDFLGLMTLLGNPLAAFIVDNDIPLINLIK